MKAPESRFVHPEKPCDNKAADVDKGTANNKVCKTLQDFHFFITPFLASEPGEQSPVRKFDTNSLAVPKARIHPAITGESQEWQRQ